MSDNSALKPSNPMTRAQFGLGGLLVYMTALAILLAGWRAWPQGLPLWVLGLATWLVCGSTVACGRRTALSFVCLIAVIFMAIVGFVVGIAYRPTSP
jgi:hypothetical protein